MRRACDSSPLLYQRRAAPIAEERGLTINESWKLEALSSGEKENGAGFFEREFKFQLRRYAVQFTSVSPLISLFATPPARQKHLNRRTGCNRGDRIPSFTVQIRCG